MKYLFAFATVLAVAAAAPQWLDESISVFPSARLSLDKTTVVDGAKATIVGPSATIHADTGKIVKSTPDVGIDFAARSVVMPKVLQWSPKMVMSDWDIMPQWEPKWDTKWEPKLRVLDSGLTRSIVF